MSGLVKVSDEFISESKNNLGQFVPNLQSGRRRGPYSKQDKQSRRNEVLKLHFEYGYSARKIADMMNMSRNTVNSDVNYWYSKLEQEFESVSVDACMAKITNRLESQRSRLREELDKASNLSEKISIDKMLLDIDNKLIQFFIKMKASDNEVYDLATKRLNEWMKEKKYDHRFMTMRSLYSFSFQTFEKITRIIKDDRVHTKYH